jgi:hypothetical protein
MAVTAAMIEVATEVGEGTGTTTTTEGECLLLVVFIIVCESLPWQHGCEETTYVMKKT